jgi:hypothetical protein
MNTTDTATSTPSSLWSSASRDQRLGYGLLALGGLVVLGTISHAVSASFVLGAMALGLLYAYRRTRLHGFVVPGGVFAGIAVGAFLEGVLPFEGVFLLGFAAGFWLIQRLEPKRHPWAQYPAWFFAGIAALVFVTEHAWLVALALVLLGLMLLRRNERTHDAALEVSPTPVPTPPPSNLERLRQWRTATAAAERQSEAEVLRTEQLERLAQMRPENVDALFGVLDTQQIERYGKALLEVLRA